MIIFNLKIRSKRDSRAWVRERFYQSKPDSELTRGQKSSLTKRTNILWENISGPIFRVEIVGGQGVYRVHAPYVHRIGGILGHVFAENREMALTLAKFFFGHLTPDQTTIRVRFVEMCESPQHLEQYNTKLIQEYKSKLDDDSAGITKANKRIESLKMRIESIESIISLPPSIFIA